MRWKCTPLAVVIAAVLGMAAQTTWPSQHQSQQYGVMVSLKSVQEMVICFYLMVCYAVFVRLCQLTILLIWVNHLILFLFLESGKAYGCGYGGRGQLGQGNTNWTNPTPIQIKTNGSVKAIFGGMGTSFLVLCECSSLSHLVVSVSDDEKRLLWKERVCVICE